MCAQNKKSCELISVNANTQGRSVARCREKKLTYCPIKYGKTRRKLGDRDGK